MNISKFTQKSLQAVNECEKIAYEYGNQEIEQEHLLYSLLTQEDSLIWKLIEKMEINQQHFKGRVENALSRRPKVSGGQAYIGQYLNKTLPNKRYFYVTADYTWGHTTEASLRQATASDNVGQHAGVRTPFPGARLADYTDALTQAAASNAEILALVLFGEDLVRAMRIAHDLGQCLSIHVAPLS